MKFIISIFTLFLILILFFIYQNNLKQEINLKLIEKKIETIDKKIETIDKKISKFDLHFVNNIEILIKKNKKNFLNKDKFTSLIKKHKIKNLNIVKFKNKSFAGSDIFYSKPGSYIDILNNKLLLVNWDGSHYLSKENLQNFENNVPEKISFIKIENNLDVFINSLNFFETNNSQSVRDIFVQNNEIYLSLVNQILKDENNNEKLYCYKIEIFKASITEKNKFINYKKIFSPKECFKSAEVGESDASQSGGRIISVNDNIVVSFGEYRQREYAQNDKYEIGKIFNITENKIISKGHRNPQGLYFDKDKNIILSTEHGPKGGDEINLINLNSKKIYNFGWPISSYGNHYDGKKRETAPLHKSHKKYGFEEPIKYFDISIGISEIAKIKKNSYLVGSMSTKNRVKAGSRSLYFFELNNLNQVVNEKFIPIYDRIRDIKVYNNLVILSCENNSDIAFIKIDDILALR